jgi:hypothetical protein
LVVLKHSQFNLLSHRTVSGALLEKLQELLKVVPQTTPLSAEAVARLHGKSTAGQKQQMKKEASGAARAEFTPLMMQMLEVWRSLTVLLHWDVGVFVCS